MAVQEEKLTHIVQPTQITATGHEGSQPASLSSPNTSQSQHGGRSKSQNRLELLPPLQIGALTSPTSDLTARPVSPLPGGLAAVLRRDSNAQGDLSASVASPVRETPSLSLSHDPKTGSRYLNQYLILGELGRGVHGKVKLARDSTTQQTVAIKIVDRESKRRKLARRPEKEAFSSKISPLNRDEPVSHQAEQAGSSGQGSSSALSTNEDKIRREIAIFKKCQHEHVVGLLEVIDDPSSKKIFMVLEYMAGGEIQWKAARQYGLAEEPALSVEEARRIFRDVSSGLRYLHHQGIIHRDIKPANLLHTGSPDFTVKISDFGVSHLSHAIERAQRRVDEDAEKSSSHSADAGQDKDKLKKMAVFRDDYELAKTAGSPAFFAPELCFPPDLSPSADGSHDTWNRLAENTRPPITKAIDVWALGVTLYCILFAKCPFMADTEYELFNKIPSERVIFPARMGKERTPTHKDAGGATIDTDVIDLLTRLLEKDPSKRITLHDAMRHPWTLRGLENPSTWLGEADACQLDKPIEVTHDEVHHGLTVRDRFVHRFTKFKNKFRDFGRRRGKSLSESEDGSKKASAEAPSVRHVSTGTVKPSDALMPPPPVSAINRSRLEARDQSEVESGMTADESMSALGDTDLDSHYWRNCLPLDPMSARGYRASSFSSNGSSAPPGQKGTSSAFPRSNRVLLGDYLEATPSAADSGNGFTQTPQSMASLTSSPTPGALASRPGRTHSTLSHEVPYGSSESNPPSRSSPIPVPRSELSKKHGAYAGRALPETSSPETRTNEERPAALKESKEVRGFRKALRAISRTRDNQIEYSDSSNVNDIHLDASRGRPSGSRFLTTADGQEMGEGQRGKEIFSSDNNSEASFSVQSSFLGASSIRDSPSASASRMRNIESTIDSRPEDSTFGVASILSDDDAALVGDDYSDDDEDYGTNASYTFQNSRPQSRKTSEDVVDGRSRIRDHDVLNALRTDGVSSLEKSGTDPSGRLRGGKYYTTDRLTNDANALSSATASTAPSDIFSPPMLSSHRTSAAFKDLTDPEQEILDLDSKRDTASSNSMSNCSSPFIEGPGGIENQLFAKASVVPAPQPKRRTMFSMGSQRQGSRSRTISNEGSTIDNGFTGNYTHIDPARSDSDHSHSSHDDEDDERGYSHDGFGYYDDGGMSGPGYMFGYGNESTGAHLPIDDQHISRQSVPLHETEKADHGDPKAVGDILQSTSDLSQGGLTELGAKEMSDVALQVQQQLE